MNIIKRWIKRALFHSECHEWANVGIWTRYDYKSFPLLRCKQCGVKKYIGLKP